MEEFIELLKILLPSVVVFLTVYLVIRKYFDQQTKTQMKEIRAEAHKTILPLRLQAYERVVLFLERISPGSIVMRTYKPGMSAKLLQAELVRTIREEYEHNMTQQVYVSTNTWALVRNAKEEITRLINVSATHLGPDANGIELSQIIFETSAKIDKLPTDVAITYAKNEIQKLFS